MNAYVKAIRKMSKQQRRQVAKATLKAIRYSSNTYHRKKMGVVSGYLMALEDMEIITREERYAVYDRARRLLLKYGKRAA